VKIPVRDGSKQVEIDMQAVEAAARIVTEHSTFIRSIIRYQAPNEFQEDDLFQEFFLSMVRKPLPPDTQNVRSYLYRAITNDVIDTCRRETKLRHSLKKYARKNEIRINKWLPEDALALVEEEGALFGQLAAHLRRKEAEAVTLRYRDDCSIAEISEKMGITKRSVSRYLSAGLRRLRRVLAVD